MHAERGLAGTGGSLAGALQMVVSGVTTSLIVHIHLDSPFAMSASILAAALIGFALAPRGRSI
jgi:hypothetical protein